MKTIAEIIKSTFISPEFITIIFVGLLEIFIKKYFISFGSLILVNSSISNTTIPIVGFLIIFSITNGLKILKPKTNNKKLYEWDKYWKLKFRVYLSIVYVLLGSLLFCIVLFFSQYIEVELVAYFYLLSLGLTIIPNVDRKSVV